MDSCFQDFAHFLQVRYCMQLLIAVCLLKLLTLRLSTLLPSLACASCVPCTALPLSAWVAAHFA